MERIPDDELPAAIAGLSWSLEEGELVKVIQREDFAAALALVNEIAAMAEEMDHHPDITLSWNTVSLRLHTHFVGGITEKDIALASRIDQIA